MRRFYPLLLVAFVASSVMGAKPFPAKSFSNIDGDKNAPVSSENRLEVSKIFKSERIIEVSGMHRLPKTPRSEQRSESKYAGNYILTLCDDIFSNSSGLSNSIEVEVSVDNNTLTISSEEFDAPIIAQFDESTGVVTFVNQYLGTGGKRAYSYLPVDFSKQQYLCDSFRATFNEDGTSLAFPADTGFMEAAWEWSSSSQQNDAINAAKSFDIESDYFLGYTYGRTFVSMTKGGFSFASAGKATYYDGLMIVNEAVNEIYSWEIEIEKCNEIETLYRVKPYSVENPVGKALGLGIDDNTFFYIDITDESKVFTKGEFSPYNVNTFCGVNGENGFDAEKYGTFNDGVINFPDKSFAYQNENSWYFVNSDGQPNMRIVFDGAVIKDYTIEATTESNVSADNKWTVELTKGADVASVKYMVVPDEIAYETLVNYDIDFDEYGVEASGDSFVIEPAKNNILGEPMTTSDYVTVFIASFDAKGNKQDLTQLDLTVLFADQEEGWTSVGKTEFVDPFVAPVFGEKFSAQVEVQAKSDNSPVYRLVLPYETFPADFNLAGLTTSMVIDATDPTWVEIPAYFTGVNAGYGMTAVGSITALGYTKDTAPAGIGAVTMSNNIVNFAARSAFVHLPEYSGPGKWSQLNATNQFSLPAISLNITVKNEEGVPVEGASVSLKDILDTLQEFTTDATGKVTVNIPLSVGYFGSFKLYVNNTPNEVKLNGAENSVEITLSNSAIREIINADSAKEIYDILGRRVVNPSAGLYIINGNKTVIK